MSENIDYIIKGFKDIELINGGYFGVCARLVLDIIDQTDGKVIRENFVTHNQYSLQTVTDEQIFEYYYEDEEFDEEHQLTDEMISEYFQMLLDEAYEDTKDILAEGGYIPYDGNYHKELDVWDEIEELLPPDEEDDEPNDDESPAEEKPKRLYSINGKDYTSEEIISILREQIPQLKEYAHFADAEIELGYVNKEGELFFLVSNDDGTDMLVKIGQDENIYWDWTGRVLD